MKFDEMKKYRIMQQVVKGPKAERMQKMEDEKFKMENTLSTKIKWL